MHKTRVLLVRHGATMLTEEDRFAGATDVLLGPAGEDQAQKLAQRLSHSDIAAVYCSPMKRTVRTAEILAAPHKLPLKPLEGLREINHGHWEGLTRAEVEEQFVGEYENWSADPFTYAPPGGESGLAVLNRSLPHMRDIVEAHAGQTVLVVSHKATIRLLIGAYLGFDLRRYRDNLDQQPCCLNVLEFTVAKPIKARLSLFNDISHYNERQECKAQEPRMSKAWNFSTSAPAKE